MDYCETPTVYITVSEDCKEEVLFFEDVSLSKEFLAFIKSVPWMHWEKRPNENDKLQWYLVVNLERSDCDEVVLIEKLIAEDCFLECRYSEDEEYTSDYKKFFYGE